MTTRNQGLFLNDKGGRGERPWERGWNKAIILTTMKLNSLNSDDSEHQQHGKFSQGYEKNSLNMMIALVFVMLTLTAMKR